MGMAPQLVASGVRVIDLAADFRLRDPVSWERWYGMPHAALELLAEAVYGLPEVNREQIAQARVGEFGLVELVVLGDGLI